MAKCTAVLGPTAMSATGLTETSLGNWVVPAGTKSISGIRASYVSSTTQDITMKIPILRVYSQDISFEPCQMMFEGEAGCIANSNGGRFRESTYFPINKGGLKGGETITIYGMLAVTTATAGVMTVTIYFSDQGPIGGQFHYKMYTTPSATVVTAATKNTATAVYALVGANKITAAYGWVWMTLSTAGTGCAGKFRLESPDFKVPYAIEFANEGGSSLLLANNQDSHLTKVGHDVNDDPYFEVPVNPNLCNITGSWTAGPATLVGAFLTGVQYQ